LSTVTVSVRVRREVKEELERAGIDVADGCEEVSRGACVENPARENDREMGPVVIGC